MKLDFSNIDIPSKEEKPESFSRSKLLYQEFGSKMSLTQRQLEFLWEDFSYEVRAESWLDENNENNKKEFLAYLILISKGVENFMLCWDDDIDKVLMKKYK